MVSRFPLQKPDRASKMATAELEKVTKNIRRSKWKVIDSTIPGKKGGMYLKQINNSIVTLFFLHEGREQIWLSRGFLCFFLQLFYFWAAKKQLSNKKNALWASSEQCQTIFGLFHNRFSVKSQNNPEYARGGSGLFRVRLPVLIFRISPKSSVLRECQSKDMYTIKKNTKLIKM